jgi:hypothetical protein
MNLYFVDGEAWKMQHTFLVIASSAEEAEKIFKLKMKQNPKKTPQRVKSGHYIVGATFVVDDVS